MSKTTATIDGKQLALDFTAQVDTLLDAKAQLILAIEAKTTPHQVESADEACIEIAAAVKRALRESGLSREELVEGINRYFGRPSTPLDSAQGKPLRDQTHSHTLTIHMLNHYLSKPTDYPIPAYYLFAIHHVCNSLEPARAIVAAEGARVASGAEVRQMQLGKLEETLMEMHRLKRELKGRMP